MDINEGFPLVSPCLPHMHAHIKAHTTHSMKQILKLDIHM